MSNTITVIIPVHELNEVTEPKFKEALVSIKNQTIAPEGVLVVVPTNSGLMEKSFEISKSVGLEISVAENSGDTDFASQMNHGVSEISTSHFMFLEYDDTLTDIWVKNAKEYLKAYAKDIDMFLPVIANVNDEGQVLGLTNEPVWANEFSDKLGELDNETLIRYNDFNFDGMVMSVEKYNEIGGLKPSMKLVFPLEFMLRAIEMDGRIMVIPKVGYKHHIQREGSLFDTFKKTLSVDEQRWWLALAKKEYFHTKDRKITYEKED
jgi:hypothetical protein